MGLVTAILWETAVHVIAMSVLMLNLCKIQCAIWHFHVSVHYFPAQEKMDHYSVNIIYSVYTL